MKKITLAAFLAALLIGALSLPASARDPKTEAEIEAVEGIYNSTVEDEREKVVCKKEAVIGSLIKETVCRTVSDMEFAERSGKRLLNKPKTTVTREGLPGG